MKIIAINGRFMARRQTGQERFATEVVRALDRLCKPGQYELIIPMETEKTLELKNIKIVKYGNMKSHMWEQINFAWYSYKNKRISLNLCTIHPLFNPGIVCIHDISYKINPHFFRTRYGRLSAIWHKVNYYTATKKSPVIFTVTENSKKEIIKQYHIKPERIVVVPNGWEHITEICEDAGVGRKIPQIKMNRFYISIGSLAPNKNMKWVFEVAKNNPNEQFVIVGRSSLSEYGVSFEDSNINNVVLTGYLTDEELKYLILNCKALIFPSVYEGFGIPPLEAIALGKQAIISNTSCLPEIFDGYVHYLDPTNPNIDINALLSTKVKHPQKLLKKYRYSNAAKIINETMRQLEGEA